MKPQTSSSIGIKRQHQYVYVQSSTVGNLREIITGYQSAGLQNNIHRSSGLAGLIGGQVTQKNRTQILIYSNTLSTLS